MKSYYSLIYRFIRILILASLVSACSSAATATEAPVEPVAPAQPLTEYPSDNATRSPSENFDLQTASFDATAIITDKLEGLDVFIGSGSVPNNQGQTLQVTATGTSSDYIIEYFKVAKFNFEIKDINIPPSPNIIPIQSINFSVSDVLKADKANLLIRIDLPPETKEKYPKGTLYVTVDPVIGEKQQHIYLPTDPSTNQADVEVTSQQGAVEGSLYLQNVGLLDAKKTSGPNIPEIISGAGEGIFDFVVTGLEPGNNEYRLRGTWSYGYTDLPPIEPTLTPAESMEAESIMAKMIETYGNLTTYQDSGTDTDTFFDGSGNNVTQIIKKSFTIAFLRSGQFRFQYIEEGDDKNNYIIWSDGQETQIWWGFQPGIEKKESLTGALTEASGVSNGTSYQVPLMLIISGLRVSDSGFGYLFPFTRLDDAPCNFNICFRVEGQSSRDFTYSDGTTSHVDETVILWIEKDTYLLVIKEEFAQHDTFRTEGLTLYHPIVNQEIPPSFFEPAVP